MRLLRAVAIALGLALSGPAVAIAQPAVPVLPCASTQLALCGPISYNNPGAAITTATTTLVITGVAGQRIYAYFLAALASGTNTTDNFYYEYGTGATCGTGTVKLTPTSITAPSASPNVTTQWAGAALSNAAQAGWVPAEYPVIIPAGNNLCIVTAGTTIALFPIVFYSLY
jgi:hypothetical protein